MAGVSTPGGKTTWQVATVKSILTNEKYKGDALLQKTYTVDFLTKKQKINEGEIPQYYVENSHPAIISPDIYEMVKEEFRRRNEAGRYATSVSILSGRIMCGECGGFYGRKVWHAGSKYANTVWHCNNKFQKRKYCSTPTLKEDTIKEAFAEAFNSMIENKDEIFANYDTMLAVITDDSSYVKEIKEIDQECAEIETNIERLIAANARSVVDPVDYNKRYNEYVGQYDTLQIHRKELSSKVAMCEAKRVQIKGFLAELEKQNKLLTEFDENVWQTTLSVMKIWPGGKVKFIFRDGTELPWTIDCEVSSHTGKKTCQ